MTIPPSLAQPSIVQAPLEELDPNAINKSIIDAKGDLVTGTANDTPARLAVGTDGQVLLADSSTATGLRWGADPTAATVDAKGDILVGTAPDTVGRLPVGTNGQVLVADSSTGTGLAWSSEADPTAIQKAIVDAKGDLIAATAADTPARLPIGTDGQYLVANSGASTGMAWTTPNIALGTETTGNYVAGITGGTGVTVTGSGSEGATPTVAIGQDVGTGSSVAFGGLNVDTGTLYVDASNNRVGVNNLTPAYSLDVTGDGHFTSNLTVDGTLYAPHVHGDLAGLVYFHVKNTTASTIPNGTPVYITGTVGSTQVCEIAPADASNTAKMPAIGITDGDIIAGANGHAVIVGDLDSQNTNAYSINQPLYVASGGGLTGTRPSGASDVIQIVGHVSRVNTNTGGIVVACGPSATTPNSISVTGNIATTAGQFTGSGAGLTSLNASNLSTGTVPSSVIGNDSIALGTKTTGNYVQTVSGGTGVTVTGGTGEGSTPSIAIGQAVATTDSPQFAAITTTGTANLNAASVTTSVSANSLSATTSISGSTLFVDSIEIDTTGATSNQVLTYNGTKFAPATPSSGGIPATILDAKGDIIVATAADTADRLAVGSTNQLLVVDSATSTGLKWASTLSGLTLTSPVISTISNTGTVTLPTSTDTLVGRATTDTLTNKTINGAILDRTEENWNIVASAATGTIALDVLTASIWYYTSNATANHTVNVRGDGSTTLSSLLNTGDSITVVWANTNGATAYYPNTFQVDGSSVTPKWQGGTAPTAGNASAIDVYSYTIVKTAATPTYTVFASQTQFK